MFLRSCLYEQTAASFLIHFTGAQATRHNTLGARATHLNTLVGARATHPICQLYGRHPTTTIVSGSEATLSLEG